MTYPVARLGNRMITAMTTASSGRGIGVLHIGAAGSGYTVKLLVNLLWFGQAIANAEALSLAVRSGIEPATVRHAVQQSAAASRFMEQDAPALMRGENLTSFSLARCVEELSGVLMLGGQYDVTLALGGARHRAVRRGAGAVR